MKNAQEQRQLDCRLFCLVGFLFIPPYIPHSSTNEVWEWHEDQQMWCGQKGPCPSGQVVVMDPDLQLPSKVMKSSLNWISEKIPSSFCLLHVFGSPQRCVAHGRSQLSASQRFHETLKQVSIGVAQSHTELITQQTFHPNLWVRRTPPSLHDCCLSGPNVSTVSAELWTVKTFSSGGISSLLLKHRRDAAVALTVHDLPERGAAGLGGGPAARGGPAALWGGLGGCQQR